MRSKSVLIPWVILLALICGCAPAYYVGDQSFKDPGAAEARHRDILDQTLLGISRTESPIGGSALLVLPTRDLIERDGIIMLAGSRSQASEDQIQYIVGYLDREFEFTHEALKRRGIFDDVVLKRSDTPASHDMGSQDYGIYMKFPAPDSDPGESEWYVKERNWASPRIVPAADGAVGRVEAAQGWFDNLEKQLRTDQE